MKPETAERPDAQVARLRIDPAAMGGLEQFHDRAGNVEDEDDLCLFQRFQPVQSIRICISTAPMTRKS
jgi:hypothetical protein